MLFHGRCVKYRAKRKKRCVVVVLVVVCVEGGGDWQSLESKFAIGVNAEQRGGLVEALVDVGQHILEALKTDENSEDKNMKEGRKKGRKEGRKEGNGCQNQCVSIYLFPLGN